MAAIVSDDLLSVLDERKRAGDGGAGEVRVILTLAEDADLAALEAEGFKLERKFEAIPAVAGTLPADKEKALRFAKRVRGVEKIEYDGEVRALTDTDCE